MAQRARSTATIIPFNGGAATATSLSQEPDEQRRAPRRRMLKAAVAAYNDRHCTVPCTVRDISATGAKLRAASSLGIPDTFELIIELDGLEADCEVVWRKDNDIGVRFLGAPRRCEPRRHQVIAAQAPERSPTLRKKPRGEPTRPVK